VDRSPGGRRVCVTTRTRRPEERRGEILDAALELFSERGYHATGVADIAAELNMSHGTFYKYFKSKRDILEQMVDQAERRISDHVAGVTDPHDLGTPAEYRDEARRVAAAMLRVIHDDARLGRLLLLVATGVDDALTMRMLGIADRMRELTSEYLRHGVRHGWLRSDLAIVETARAVNGMIYAGAIRAVREGAEPDRYVGAAVRMMFDGISS
jgi:AcrR family transcriptional regulator